MPAIGSCPEITSTSASRLYVYDAERQLLSAPTPVPRGAGIGGPERRCYADRDTAFGKDGDPSACCLEAAKCGDVSALPSCDAK